MRRLFFPAFRTCSATAVLLAISLSLGASGKGLITGRAVNIRGQPLKGVEINAENTLAIHSNLTTYTDANGFYSFDVNNIATTWHLSAHASLKYNGYTAQIALIPDRDEALPGLVGGVRNFTLMPKPVTPEDPYGSLGMIIIDPANGEFDLDLSKVRVTITPVGPLADGSAGTSQVVALQQTNSGWLIPNVIWGNYKVTAKMNGQPLELRRRAMGVHDFSWNTTYTGGFYVDYYLPLPNMFLEARQPGQP